MKKFTALLLTSIICLSFTACSGSEISTSASKEQSTTEVLDNIIEKAEETLEKGIEEAENLIDNEISENKNESVEVEESAETEESLDAAESADPEESVHTEENTESVAVEESTESEESIDAEESAESEESDPELVNGMRPEFKEAMDSYEEFMYEYCEFMVEYSDNPTDLKMITKYAEFMKQYVETSEKLEAWDDGEMNDVETQYYIEVTTRVSQKLLDASVTIE